MSADKYNAEFGDPSSFFGEIVDELLNEIYIFDCSTLRFYYANKGACKNTGYTLEELTQLTPIDIKPKYDKASFESLLAPLKSGKKKKIEFETTHRRKDGSLYPVEVHIQYGHLRSQTAFIAIILDLTERKNTFRQLKEKGQRLSAILNNAAEAIITINSHGIIESLNPAAEEIFGYKEQEIIGKNIDILMPSPWSEKHDNYIRRYVDTGEKRIIGSSREIYGKRKDATTFPLELSVSEVVVDNERTFTGIIRDISERREAARQLQLREEEARQNKERFDELSRIGAMGQLAASITHEINQPLTAISTYAQSCNRMINNKQIDIDELQPLLLKINQQTQRAAEVVHRLRSLINKQEIQPELVDVNELIEEVVELAASRAQLEGVDIEVKPIRLSHALECDRIQIQQVILNLIYNAIDAYRNCDKSTKKIIVSAREEGKSVKIIVRDFGDGIKPADREKIFSAFFTTKAENMGIGLSISLSIMEAHDGDLSFNEDIKDGSEFYLRLPVKGSSNTPL